MIGIFSGAILNRVPRLQRFLWPEVATSLSCVRRGRRRRRPLARFIHFKHIVICQYSADDICLNGIEIYSGQEFIEAFINNGAGR